MTVIHASEIFVIKYVNYLLLLLFETSSNSISETEKIVSKG